MPSLQRTYRVAGIDLNTCRMRSSTIMKTEMKTHRGSRLQE